MKLQYRILFFIVFSTNVIFAEDNNTDKDTTTSVSPGLADMHLTISEDTAQQPLQSGDISLKSSEYISLLEENQKLAIIGTVIWSLGITLQTSVLFADPEFPDGMISILAFSGFFSELLGPIPSCIAERRTFKTLKERGAPRLSEYTSHCWALYNSSIVCEVIGMYFITSSLTDMFKTHSDSSKKVTAFVLLLTARALRGITTFSSLIRTNRAYKTELSLQPVVSSNGTFGLSAFVSY